MTQRRLLLFVSIVLSYLVAPSPGFASGTTSNLWEFRKHVEEGGALTITAVILDQNNPPPDYNSNAPGGYDDHGYELDLNAPAQLVIHTGDHKQPGTKFTAGYYRGPIYNSRGSRAPFARSEANSTNFVSIFSNNDRSELIAAVDHGLIYTSTNSGMTWKIITAPGLYKIPLRTAPDGSGLYAHATIAQPLSPPNITNPMNAPLTESYAFAFSAAGSKLVVSASASQPSPTLNIRYSIAGVTIIWPAQFTTFALEHTIDLNDGSWTAVTNAVQVVGGENRVVVSSAIGNHFFRLRDR